MHLSEIDLHDARLVSMETDYETGQVTISVDYYPLSNSAARVPARIVFNGVTQLHQLSDLIELKDHAAAGNITQWVPACGQGTTFIHLARGLIAVSAGTVAFVPAP